MKALKSNHLQPLFLVLVCIFFQHLTFSQDGLTANAVASLKQAYKQIPKPEISFEKFVEVNKHIYEGKNNRSARIQDPYCNNVRTYCSNGTFESGLDQTQWTGAYGFWYNGLYPDPFSLTYGFSSGPINSSSSHQTIVDKSSGNDPYVPIPLVAANGGTKALRLGNAVNGNGTEILAKTIVVDPNETILSFYYAVVFEDPGHYPEDQPAFSVRVYDCATGTELTNVCNLGNGTNVAVSNSKNPFFSAAYGGSVAYRNWSLAQINLSAHVGKTVIVVFDNKDCNLSGHFGYTYLDNIFSNLCPVGGPILTGQGSIAINKNTTSNCGIGKICVDYVLPTSNNQTGSVGLTLDVYQTGLKVKTLTSPTLMSGTSYCFDIDPAALGLSSTKSGFDYSVTGTFILSGFSLAPLVLGNPPNGQAAGADNDYYKTCNTYYSKSTGDLHNTATWGTNPDGSGTPPTDFGSGKTFNLANRGTAYTMTGNWTVEGTLNIPGSAYLSINGYTLTESFLGGSGSLAGSATSKLVIMGNDGGDAGLLKFTSSGAWLASLTMNRTGTGAAATLTSALSITDVLNVVNGTLNTGGMLTLASSATNTARVAPVMGTINGNVTVERFIPARRAWRILSAPVMGSQSINAAWQEGATTSSANPNPHPGYGTFITQGSASAGYDYNPVTAMMSILRYNSSSDSWLSLPNTNSTPVNSDAFMVFIRGDRGVPLSYNNVPPTNTTLRSMGTLKTGDQVFNVAATGFTGIPNPFASPINFATLTRNNVQNNFYLWDPKLGGPNGVGGYVLLSYNGSSYDVTPAAVSPESQYIQSGQGFLVHSTGAAGTLTIKESDKSATPATNVFRSATTIKGIRVTLQVNSKANSTATLDEVFTSFGNFSNEIDNLDAIKLPNIRENLGMTKAGTDLMVERRAMINRDDTIFLKLWNVEQREYELKFTIQNLSSADIQSAYLVDNYLKTTTPISLADGATVKFTIDDNQASANAQRFTLVLKANRNAFDGEITMGSSAFKILPNPMTGKTLQLQFINQPKGTYNVELVNSLGQVIYKSQYRHTGGNAMLPVRLGNNVSKGLYQVHITNAAANTKTALQVISN